MKTLISIVIAISFIAAISCQKEQATEYTQNIDEKILTIKHRIYKGECIGYCDTQFIFDTTNVTYTKMGWDTSSKSLPVIDTSFQISKIYWDSIISLININSIMELDSIYFDDDSSGVSEGVIYFELITTQRHKKIIFTNRKYLEPIDSLNRKLIEFRRGM